MQPRPLHIAPLILRILLAVAFCVELTLGLALRTHAQTQASEKTQGSTKTQAQQPPADVQELANRLAPNLSRMHPIRVLVLDFEAPDGLWLPFSAWLADQFSAALGNVGKQVEVVPRSKLTVAIAERNFKPKVAFDEKTAEALAESLEAQVIVSGSFAAIQNALGIALTYGEKEVDSWLIQRGRDDLRGKISLPSEVSDLFGITLDSLRPKDGIYQGGKGGIGFPACIRCPHPVYPIEASKKKAQGNVFLLATISVEGRATKIKVTKGAGFGFDQQAVKAVEGWEFKPAKDVDGNTVPVRQTIEVTFHLY